MAETASTRAESLQISASASASRLSREFQLGKMSAPAQGSSGGGGSSNGGGSSPGEAKSSARPRWEATRAGAPLGFASNPAYMAAQRRLKVRNALTGLAIGAVVVGIYSYTFYSVSQERFLDDLELEAKAVQAQAAKTSPN